MKYEKHKYFREALKKENTYIDAIELFMELHAMVHSSKVSDTNIQTIEDELWDNLDDNVFRRALNKKGRTIAYGIWHSTRIEDITMNLLVINATQVIDKNNWLKKINSTIYDTGNSLSKEEILDFSSSINMEELRKYRDAVGIETRNIVTSLKFTDMKNKITEAGLNNILESGSVLTDKKAIWLIDYWKTKNVAGILLMPCTRHLLVHLNESLEAKKVGVK